MIIIIVVLRMALVFWFRQRTHSTYYSREGVTRQVQVRVEYRTNCSHRHLGFTVYQIHTQCYESFGHGVAWPPRIRYVSTVRIDELIVRIDEYVAVLVLFTPTLDVFQSVRMYVIQKSFRLVVS